MAVSTFLPSASRMSPKTTFAPSRATVRASAAPWPFAPPLISATFPSSFPMSVSLWRAPAASAGARISARGRRVRGDPVPGDVDAAGEPHTLMRRHVVEHALEARRPRRMPGEAQVEPERHHPGLRPALAVEHVEAIFQEREIVVGREEAAASELRIVRREAVRSPQVRAPVHPNPVRQFVEEGGFLYEQPPGV